MKYVLALAAVAAPAMAQVRITEFMSEGQGDTLSGNGGRRQREFFEITNLGLITVDVSTWSYNDNNTNDPHYWGPAIGSIAAGESIVFTQMSDTAFRAMWNLPSSVRIFSYAQLSNLGNADTINIYHSFTQNSSTLVDSLTYTADARGSGVSRNRPWDGGTGQLDNSQWEVSFVGDDFHSRRAPNPPTFAGYEQYDYTDLANPGVYVPGPAGAAALGLGLAMRRRR
ncbi:MAG: lamin tail domain-containing protein [Phycisphaerales bacterium]|nr:lamin tail domain-containing protein [Phycisphaerales bacterium]